jgi:hypothetical protein
MLRIFSLLVLVIAFTACSTKRKSSSPSTEILASTKMPQLTNGEPFAITEISTDKTYGTAENPIKVSDGSSENRPLNERRFLNALAGPNGEEIKYNRQGSCCPFKTPNSAFGGMLDVYVITWEGQDKPVKLYINMYDEGTMKIPVGFTAKKG